MECAARRSRWQGGAAAGRCASVLHEVFRWLGGAELARAGAACRAWRAAAADTALWRRLLASHTSPASLRALREHNESLSWRQEYVNVFAKWEVRARLVTAGDAPLLHAALACSGRRLAVTAEDASVTIWDRTADGKWSELCSTSMRRCGWASAARAQWAADHSRLLVAGPLALADRWELLVLQLDDTGGCRAISRAGCSAGAAGCWARAAGDAFLSLELRRLAPLQACTTVWLNAATQETQSEYAGVTTPILRIYNEESAHITHALVTEVPLDEPIDDDSLALATAAEDGQVAPTKPYYRAVYGKRHSVASVQILVAVSWGESGIVRSWPLSALQPPPLLAATLGDLRARVQARRARAGVAADVPEQDAPEPDEAAVRALCTPPDARRRLGAAVLGLVLHSGGRCAWLSTADGRVTCLSLPELAPLCCTRADIAPTDSANYHYIQPAVSEQFLACPGGARSGRVWLWSAASGARLPAPLRHAAPALAALLPPPQPSATHHNAHIATLMVLATDALYVWQNTATAQPSPADCWNKYVLHD